MCYIEGFKCKKDLKIAGVEMLRDFSEVEVARSLDAKFPGGKKFFSGTSFCRRLIAL